MKKLIIFGQDQIGELAHYYFTHDSDYEVVAFTVDRKYITAEHFCDKPMIPFEEITQHYSPDEHHMFIAIGFSSMNSFSLMKCNIHGVIGVTAIESRLLKGFIG